MSVFARGRDGPQMITWGSLFPVLIMLVVMEGDLVHASPASPTPSTSSTSINEIESFVKRLEYEALTGEVGDDGTVVVNLNLLPDDTISEDALQGVEEEFDTVDAEQGDTTLREDDKKKERARNRQRSLIYQGVYAPDSRFNAFVDGVMVNMVAEMKRKRMDPLYFRVYDRGIIEHVNVRNGRASDQADPVTPADPDPSAAAAYLTSNTPSSRRRGRQRGSAIGGGVIRGLTNIKRFGNAEVQIAGNTTLVRGHWLTGPLDLIIDYRASSITIARVRTGLQAVQFDTLTAIDRFGAEMSDFNIISPLFDYMPYYGNRTVSQQHTTELVVRHLFSNASFMHNLMNDAFEVASYDKIIPQFGADTNYYSVLKYLFHGRPPASDAAHKDHQAPSVNMAGVADNVAAFLARTTSATRSVPIMSPSTSPWFYPNHHY